MADMLDATQANDLDKLRLCIDQEIAEHIRLGETGHINKSTKAMQAACHAAARYDHPAALDLLLERGCWIDPMTINSALDGNSKDIFDALMARGWNVNESFSHAGDALLVSVGNDNLDMVQFLLSRGADPNANHSMGMARALELAAYHASIPVIQALLNAGSELKGRSTLQYGTIQGRTSVVAYLLDQGADIDEIPNNPDLTEHGLKRGVKNPLCEAAYRGQAAVVKLLLERGADTGVRDTNGRSALELADMEGHESCVDTLNEYRR